MNSRRELRDLLAVANRARLLADEARWAARRERQEAAIMARGPIVDPAAIQTRNAALAAILRGDRT